MENRLFLVSSINKLQVLFTDYSDNATDDLPNLSIQLPIKDNHVDYDIMELLVSAIQKLVIKDVVLYADQKISATKSVIKKHNT
ncbi:type II restriction endonuclease [Candidatus Gracilibacteria bacterium]|nr:type II restriction endonuclease [Candidatus Gracilibacteria bacterium]